MRRVIVVDDEILVRIGIRTLLEREDSGYGVVGEASGGIEGAELAARLGPDIVLTDLVMAEGDGFELVRRVRASNPDAAIIVLSCRNDFELVREAMRAGADDYVFKLTLRMPELIEAFERALGRHGRPPERAESGTAAGRSRPEGFPTLAAALLRGETPAIPNIPDLERPYRMLCLEFARAGDSDEASAIAQIVRELVRADRRILEAAAFGRRALIALRNEGRGAASEVFALAEEFCRRYLGSLPCGGLSRLATRPGELPRGYAEAQRAVRAAYRGSAALVFADDSEPGPPGGETVFRAERFAAACASIRRAVEALDAPAALSALASALSELRSASDKDSDRLASLALDAFAPFKDRARSLGFELDPPGGGSADEAGSPAALVRGARNLGEIEASAPRFVRAFIAQALPRTGMRREIVEIRRWILSDLARPYAVEEAAERAGMSPSHFAHIFKKETGSSFIDFVNNSRMEHARELLLTTDLLVRQVADAVGMESLNHFGIVFRRRFGMAPNELRARRPEAGSR
jgi:two-component system response regulator YesN